MIFFSPRKSSLYITGATIQDAHHLARLHAQSFTKAWGSQTFTSLIAQKTNHCLLAHVEGKGTNDPVGFVLFRIAGGEAEIITVCTSPDYRRQGTGHRLMVEAILQVRAERAGKLILEVDENNLPAIELYQSLGMKTVAKRKGYYANKQVKVEGDVLTRSDALVMVLELG